MRSANEATPGPYVVAYLASTYPKLVLPWL
jgi:hypothetical protein